MSRLRRSNSPVKIVEILPDCGADPVRLACFPSDNFTSLAGIIISNDDPLPESLCYRLHVGCAKADLDIVRDVAGLHYVPNGEASRKTLAKNRETACIHGEDCPLGGLTVEELLIPITVDELTADQSSADVEWYN